MMGVALSLWQSCRGGGPAIVSTSSASALLSTSLSVSAPPEAQEGDLLVTVSQGSALLPILPPVGFTVAAGPTNGASIATAVFDGVTPSFLFTAAGAVDQAVMMLAVRGAEVDVAGTFGADAANPTPSTVTVTAPNSLSLTVVTSEAGQSYSMPVGWTLVASVNTRKTIAVFRRTARVGIGALLGVLVTRILGAAVGRAAQIVLRNS